MQKALLIVTVYDISILSGIPSIVADLLPLEPLPTRLATLFSVGIHDIPLLSSDRTALDGWVACTTDNILASKPQLFDTLITLPSARLHGIKRRAWSSLRTSSGFKVRATQRDLRRYQILRQEIRRLVNSGNSPDVTAPKLSTPATQNGHVRANTGPEFQHPVGYEMDALGDDSNDADGVEPQSWSALAYESFMWWASAGERRTDINEEEESDRGLFAPSSRTISSGFFVNGSSHNAHQAGATAEAPTASEVAQQVSTHSRKSTADPTSGMVSGLASDFLPQPSTVISSVQPEGSLETSIIAFFHRFTERILTTLAEIIALQDEAGDGDISESESELYSTPSKPPKKIISPYRDDPPGNVDTSVSPPHQQPSSAIEHSDTTLQEAHMEASAQQNKLERDDDDEIEITSDDLIRMGLDVWSESDHAFVRELVALYWGRQCVVRRGGLECCGVKFY